MANINMLLHVQASFYADISKHTKNMLRRLNVKESQESFDVQPTCMRLLNSFPKSSMINHVEHQLTMLDG